MTHPHPIHTFYQEHCIYLPPMMGWFVFSALLSTYNKFVFGNGHMAFPYPLLLTSLHFGIQWLISHVACAIFPHTLGTERVDRMTWKEWASISIPCGLITALDVGLSNLSLVSITITFYTMVKSSAPIFVLAWAYIFGIEKITWRLIGVIAVITAGEFLTVMGEVDFVLKGFVLCLIASILSGARWTLVQLKLQSLDPPLKTTIVTMKLLAPSMFFGMILISLFVERPWNMFTSTSDNMSEISKVFALGMVGGLLAVSMVLCEFSLILNATAIIMMIGGVLKEMITILVGVTFFGDKVNAINITGCCIVFSGVILYKLVFHLEKAEKAEKEVREKNIKENVGSKLIHESDSDLDEYNDDDDAKNNSSNNINNKNKGNIDVEDNYDDENVALEFIARRSVELVDRTTGKSPKTRSKMIMDDAIINNNYSYIDNNGDEENGYIMPSQRLV